MSALSAQAAARSNGLKISTSMQRLSSGIRINSARDDAAGLAISTRMNAKIHGIAVAMRNANDSISLTQTAEGGLSSISDNLQRIRELAVQSANATNSTSDRAALNAEALQLSAEIDRVASNTSFNGIKLLDGTFQNKMLQIGAGSSTSDSILMSIDSARIGALGVVSTKATSSVSTEQGASTVADGDLPVNGAQAHPASTPSPTKSSTGATPILNPTNGHYYEIVYSSLSWNDALAAADAASFGDQRGYLATVTSAAENAFIGSLIGPDGPGYNRSGQNLPQSMMSYCWVGGSDRQGEGVWEWIGGPEAGQTFSLNGGAVPQQYSNWFPGSNSVAEGTPGQAVRDEDGLALDRTWDYEWYDLPVEDTNFPYGEFVKEYVIEYGGVSMPPIPTPTPTPTGTASISSLVDLTTVGGAQNALVSLDAAISRISSSRASLGAYQNRLVAAAQDLDSYSMNLSAARSRIMDTDYAAETTNLAKAQIIQQASMAMLAQANQSQQGILALLK